MEKDFMGSGARTYRVEYTHWQMKNISELRELAPDPIAELNPATAAEYNIRDGEWMRIATKKDAIRVKAVTTADMMPGVVSVLHGWAGNYNENMLTELEPRTR